MTDYGRSLKGGVLSGTGDWLMVCGRIVKGGVLSGTGDF